MKLTASKWVDLDSGCWIERVNSKDGFSFAVRNSSGECLSKDGDWRAEPSPSRRDEAFLRDCRFAVFLDAANALDMAA